MQKVLPLTDAHPPPTSYRKVGYARVSTGDQDLRLQIDALVRDGVPEENIRRETVSARSKKGRPEFDKMMRELRPGDMVVAWKPDRLFRSVVDGVNFLRECEQKGVGVRILTQLHLDTSTATGKLVMHMLLAVAEFEADLTHDRTMAGLQAAKARGRIGGASQTYTDEQIRKAKEQFDRGRSWKQIAPTVRAKSGKRQGYHITVTRLRARVKELEARDAERAREAEQRDDAQGEG